MANIDRLQDPTRLPRTEYQNLNRLVLQAQRDGFLVPNKSLVTSDKNAITVSLMLAEGKTSRNPFAVNRVRMKMGIPGLPYPKDAGVTFWYKLPQELKAQIVRQNFITEMDDFGHESHYRIDEVQEAVCYWYPCEGTWIHEARVLAEAAHKLFELDLIEQYKLPAGDDYVLRDGSRINPGSLVNTLLDNTRLIQDNSGFPVYPLSELNLAS